MGMWGGGVLVAVWLAVLGVVLALARTVYEHGDGPLNWFEVFFRTGSIIYGGGQVGRGGHAGGAATGQPHCCGL